MLNALVTDTGIDEATKAKILETAIASSALMANPDKSSLLYSPESATYRKEHEYGIADLDEGNNLVTLNKVNKAGGVSSETISIDEFATQHVINGQKVKINPDSKPTKYHKRTVGEVAQARKEFPPKRSEYISDYASEALSDDNHEAHKHFTPIQLKQMKKKGKVPQGYNVHHKKPIFRCESGENPNELDNLELLTEDFHSAKNKELHWYEEGNGPYDSIGVGPQLGSENI